MEAVKDIFKVKESFKNRTTGFWIGFGAACFMLLATVLLMILYYSGQVFFHPDPKDQVRMVWLFVFLFLGAAFQLVSLFTDLKFAQIIPVIFYSLAVGMYFYLAMFPIANIVTGVNFFGDLPPGAAIAFLIVLIVGTIAAVAACFMKQRKDD